MRRYSFVLIGVIVGLICVSQTWAAQKGRPDSDVQVQDWLPTPLYQQIDEETPSDADSIASQAPASYDTCEVGLSDVTDPTTGDNHVVRHRYQSRETGGGSPADLDYDVRLLEGTTERAKWHYDVNPPTAWATVAETLSTAEANAISDYTDLRLEFIANQASGARTAAIDVSWTEFEVPDVPSAGRRRVIIAE